MITKSDIKIILTLLDLEAKMFYFLQEIQVLQ